jgi:hypothetical protein
MKRFILAIGILLMVGGVAFAAQKVGMFGVPNSSGTGPMEVDSDRAITVASDATLTVSGTTTLDGATTVNAALNPDSIEVDGEIYVDGSIYAGVIVVGNRTTPAKFAGATTLDPCATLGRGTIFINATKGNPCFCNNYGVDLSLYDGTTACFP